MQLQIVLPMISKKQIGRHTTEFQSTNRTGSTVPHFIVYKNGSYVGCTLRKFQFIYMRFYLNRSKI